MKNFKNVALGLIVCALAVGFSAFTNVERNASENDANFAISDDYLVQRVINQFTPTDVSDPDAVPNINACDPENTDYECYYQVTPAGKTNIRALSGPSDFYTPLEITSFLNATPNAYLVPVSGTSEAIYLD